MTDFLNAIRQQLAKEYGPQNRSAQQLAARAPAAKSSFIGPPSQEYALPGVAPIGPPSPSLDQLQRANWSLNAPLEQTRLRLSLADLARDTLDNFDQIDTIPLGDLFTKIPLGSGFYSRLVDAYRGLGDLDPSDHERAVSAFGASGLTDDLQEQIMRALLKEYLADHTSGREDAATTGFTVPFEHRLATLDESPAGGGPGAPLGGAAFGRGGHWTQPPSNALSGGGASAVSGAATLGVTSGVATWPGPGPDPISAASGRRDLAAPATDSASGKEAVVPPRYGTLVREADPKIPGLFYLRSPSTGRTLGTLNDKGESTFTGTAADLREAEASGAFPYAQVREVNNDAAKVLQVAGELAVKQIEAQAHADTAKAQIAYYNGQISKANAEMDIARSVEKRNQQKFAVEFEMLKLDAEMQPLTKSLKEVELARAQMGQRHEEQLFPMQLQEAQERLAMLKADREAREQEQRRRKAGDRFAQQVYPALISALMPGSQNVLGMHQQLAQQAGVDPTSNEAQAATALLQSQLGSLVDAGGA